MSLFFKNLFLINLFYLRILFNKYQLIFFKNISLKLLPKKKKHFKVVILKKKKNVCRKYKKRFFRKILKKKIKKWVNIKKQIYTHVKSPLLVLIKIPKISFKTYFHIKNIFNLNEFLLYDFYNFHKNLILNPIRKNKLNYSKLTTKLWKKINFFFYIKNSIDVFRTNILKFFKTTFKTTSTTNLFFNTFTSLTPLSYIWFFEYNIVYFLIKLKWVESIGQSIILVKNNFFFYNSNSILSRWFVLNSGNCLQSIFCLIFLVKIKNLIIKLFKFFKKTHVFVKRTLLKPKRYRIKFPSIINSSQYLSSLKYFNSYFYEQDIKTLSVILLPLANPKQYLNTVTLFWLNFWNFRLTLWKYII